MSRSVRVQPRDASIQVDYVYLTTEERRTLRETNHEYFSKQQRKEHRELLRFQLKWKKVMFPALLAMEKHPMLYGSLSAALSDSRGLQNLFRSHRICASILDMLFGFVSGRRRTRMADALAERVGLRP